MAARAIWKGTVRVAELLCRVALYGAASSGGRVAFHTVNRETGNRVRRVFADAETGEDVPADEQVKGYGDGEAGPVVLEPAEIAAVVPESDKTLTVERFIACGAIDTVYFDKPYFLAPADAAAGEAFVLLRDAMRERGVAAVARAVLFRRLRSVLIRPHGEELIAHTLHFDYEVRSEAAAFEAVEQPRIEGEMLALARHIIKTKSGKFDPAAFEDRYEAALAELVRAKMEGRKLPAAPRAVKPSGDLMAALRESAGLQSEGAPPAKKRPARKKAAAAKAAPAKGARGRGRKAA